MDKLLVPDFLLKFKCIGSECENTCCQGWDIHVDKNTYKKYKKIKNPKIKTKILESVTLNPNRTNDNDYSKIKLSENKLCPLLDENMLCGVHKELGQKALCYTCKIYPRNYNKVGDLYEQSLMVSCPEVARLALLNKEKMSFTEMPLKESIDKVSRLMDKNQEIFWMVRVFTIEVIQNRNFKLWERIAILGVFFEQSSEFIELGEKDKIYTSIESFKAILCSNEIHSILNQYKKNSESQIKFSLLFNEIRKIDIKDKVFKEIMDALDKGLMKDSELDINIVKKYNENYEAYFKSFINDYEHILENYLVHYVFINLFPFSSDKTAFDEYYIFALNYVLIKTYLIGISGSYLRLDEDLAIKLIHSYTRVYGHGASIIQTVYNYFKEKKLMTLENMIFLVRD